MLQGLTPFLSARRSPRVLLVYSVRGAVAHGAQTLSGVIEPLVRPPDLPTRLRALAEGARARKAAVADVDTDTAAFALAQLALANVVLEISAAITPVAALAVPVGLADTHLVRVAFANLAFEVDAARLAAELRARGVADAGDLSVLRAPFRALGRGALVVLGTRLAVSQPCLACSLA